MSENLVDPLLAPDDNLATLSQRQDGYRSFQDSYFAGQRRTVTADGLAYVSTLTIDDVVIALVGLNSAWLAEGGQEDHGNLLVGERQVLNALDVAGKCDPHIVIAMSHHPLHLLREFDRNAVTNRINDRCHFFHCGHLHQPEARGAGFSLQTVADGITSQTSTRRNTMTTARKPRFIAFTVTGEGKQAFWTRIGSVWPQANGEGLNIELSALPVNGRIILMPPKADAPAVAEGGQA